jgi:hypothetical protein
MMNPLLKDQLLAVFRRQRRMRLALQLAPCWGVLALLGLLVKGSGTSSSNGWLVGIALLALVAGVVIHVRNRRSVPDWQDLARRIEKQHPELKGLLLTAVQQEPAPDGRLHYLQRRVLQDALVHGHQHRWSRVVPGFQVAGAQLVHLIALAALLGMLVALRVPSQRTATVAMFEIKKGITVTPGDVSLERGSRLVVVATFGGTIPAKVELVTGAGGTSEKRLPLVKSLSDPIFGGSIPEVNTNMSYRVEYGGKKTRDFKVKVFEFPRLERADADLTFPEYTALSPKRIENTRRISAVEGSTCDWTLQLNKPVVQARFIARDNTSNAVLLVVASNQPLATLSGMQLETNRTYLLQLIDAEGRTNKAVTQFVFDVLKNREPDLKIASPRGDSRPSALEEVAFEGTVWDDFGVQAYGIAFAQAGEDIQFVELGQKVPTKEKRPFKHLLRLEDLGAQPDQLITWFLWAEDIGPDGQLRRTAGDMYFAEVRPFDEVFRQSQAGAGGGQQEQQGGESGNAGGGGSPQTQLAELQKQIINATWKLQRQQARERVTAPEKPVKPGEKSSGGTSSVKTPSAIRAELHFMKTARVVFGQPAPGASSATPVERVRERISGLSGTNRTGSASQFADDLKVVRDAVEQAIAQAQEARQQPNGARDVALWEELIREMEKSRDALDQVAKSQVTLEEVLAAERSAFQVLLRLQQREYEVSRNRNQSQSSQNQSSRNQQMQQQLEQLDLTQPENRYQNERLAQSPQSPERREQMQVMNRLSELARRQQDLNERLQELQTALQEAQTEQEREEIRRQLKRLQEEQQQMLADVDELQQRMNQAENQQNMNEQRQQLEQTREQMQRASEAAQQGEVSQALASGTRAQRELEQMREQMRQQNSGAFSEDLRQLRSEAREAERRQQEIQKQVDSLADGEQMTLDDAEQRRELVDRLNQQSQRLTNLVARATELSQQTEEAEPIASRELYDTLRNFSQKDDSSVRSLEDELIERGLVQSELYRRLTQLEKSEGVKSVELTQEMIRQGLLPQAQQAGETASAAVSELRRGIEAAAEKVVGDDTEALRRAQQQLEQLTEQIEREIAQGAGAGSTNANGQMQAGAQGRSGDPSQTNGVGRAGEQAANNRQAQSGQGEQPQNSSGNQPGEGQQAPNAGQGRARGENQNQNQNREPGQNQTGSGGGEAQTAEANPGQGTNEGTLPENREARAQNREGTPRQRNGSPQRGGSASGLPEELQQFLNAGGASGGTQWGSVFTGEDFTPWSDGLREVEEMVDDPALQGQLAAARERARRLRQEFRNTRETLPWTEVQSQVVKPLVEVRNQIAEELARRGPRENLVPIDRDPVPNRYSDMVRRYYEELGRDK